MKNSNPFIAENEVIEFENRVKSFLADENAQIFIFSQMNEYLLQGLSISSDFYYKVKLEDGLKLVEGLEHIRVNGVNTTSSETLFVLFSSLEEYNKWRSQRLLSDESFLAYPTFETEAEKDAFFIGLTLSKKYL